MNKLTGPMNLRTFQSEEEIQYVMDSSPSTDRPQRAWLNHEDRPERLLYFSHELLIVRYCVSFIYAITTQILKSRIEFLRLCSNDLVVK